jgi:hypothetical protein
MGTKQAFWLDEEFDREHAANGRSRYEETVLDRVEEFANSWGDISPVGFACTAWTLATRLYPGYVRWHRRITAALCSRSDWDGNLIAQVMLVSPWPAELTHSREWWRDRGWRDWPDVFGQYVPPSEEDTSRAPHLRGLLVIDAPVPLTDLPPSPASADEDLPHMARRAVTVLVRELNELVTPIVRQLDQGLPPPTPSH